jgi:Tfp pilus assembly protein PilF
MSDLKNPSSDAALQQAIAQHRAGRLPEAIALYRKALALEPRRTEALINLGGALTALGRLDEAAKVLEEALRYKPDSAAAHNNLGLVREHQGKWEEAAVAYRRAVVLAPDYGDAYFNLGNALLQQGKYDPAIGAYRQVLALTPDHADALFNLGNIFLHQNRPADAAGLYSQVLALRPDFARAHYNLGLALCQDGKIAEGFAAFTRQASLVYRRGVPPGGASDSPHKAHHDREQRDYLAGGTAPADAPAIDAIFRLADGERLAAPAIDSAHATNIMERWASSRPQVVVVDNILTPEALSKLRHFCWDSTVWRKAHADGYLIAAPEHGFAPPLLAQIAEELRSTFTAILAAHPFQHLAGFKGDATLTGAKLHADNAAVNVNIWLTPDEANLDPDSGGMVIWDITAPSEHELARFNGDTAAIRAYLAGKGAKPLVIPYRANRAVIFDSGLIHKTDKMKFRDGYTNRRINLTLLYGRRDQ